MRTPADYKGKSSEEIDRMLKEELDITLGMRDSEGNLYPDVEGNQKDIHQLRIRDLIPFPDHPWHIRHDETFENIKNSIADVGVLTPITVVKCEDGDGYYIISGHTRKAACEELGIRSIPARILDVDMDTATIMMVCSNFQREQSLTSEKVKAYVMMNESMKKTAGRKAKVSGKEMITESGIISPQDSDDKRIVPDFGTISPQGSNDKRIVPDSGTISPQGSKDKRIVPDSGTIKYSRTVETIADLSGQSKSSIINYIKLNSLLPKFLEEIDNGRISVAAGVQLAGLTEEQQNDVLFAMSILRLLEDKSRTTILTEDAARLIRTLSRSDDWNLEEIKNIITPQKKHKSGSQTWKIDAKGIAREFPTSVKVEEYNDIIKELIRQHYTVGKPKDAMVNGEGKTFDEVLMEAVAKGEL